MADCSLGRLFPQWAVPMAGCSHSGLFPWQTVPTAVSSHSTVATADCSIIKLSPQHISNTMWSEGNSTIPDAILLFCICRELVCVRIQSVFHGVIACRCEHDSVLLCVLVCGHYWRSHSDFAYPPPPTCLSNNHKTFTMPCLNIVLSRCVVICTVSVYT